MHTITRTAIGIPRSGKIASKLKKGAAASGDPEVSQDAERARTEIVSVAESEADRLLASKSLREAVDLLTLVASADVLKSGKLESARRQHEEFLAAEYERHAQQGDAALERKDWASAEQHYRAAIAVRDGGRATGLAKYAGALAKGDEATNRRDFAAAAAAYKEGINSGLDKAGHAGERLRTVEIRPYAIRIRSLLVKPIRPDGLPWVGPPSPLLGNLVKAAATYMAPGVGTIVASAVVDAAEKVPPENRPLLHVVTTLPDGRKLQTPAKKSLYVVYDSEVVLASNYFDDRKLSFKVVGAGDNVDDVGVVEIPMKELVAKRQIILADQSVLSLQLVADPVDGKSDGMFAEMTPTADGANLASAFSVPGPASRGYRLVAVEAGAASADVPSELLDGATDLYVAIHQGDRMVFMSPTKQDTSRASWTPSNTFLFMEPGQSITVSLWDKDIENDDRIFYANITEQALATGTAEVATQAGSFILLRFEKRLDSRQQLQASR